MYFSLHIAAFDSCKNIVNYKNWYSNDSSNISNKLNIILSLKLQF